MLQPPRNNSSAVMQQRIEPKGSLDYFPTPLWATRALCEHVIMPGGTVIEPACGEGHMARPLGEYFKTVIASDIHDYGYGETIDYLNTPMKTDWIITNPPFNLAEQFIHKAFSEAKEGVAMLVRSSFMESIGRYERLYSKNPPNIIAPFAERVTMVKGRLDRKVSTATSYAWFVWFPEIVMGTTIMHWIPPCKKQLDKEEDWK